MVIIMMLISNPGHHHQIHVGEGTSKSNMHIFFIRKNLIYKQCPPQLQIVYGYNYDAALTCFIYKCFTHSSTSTTISLDKNITL